MNTFFKGFLYAAAGLLMLAALFILYIQMSWNQTYDVSLDEEFNVEITEEAVEKGRYLVYGPGHCAYCHTTTDQWPALNDGEDVPMSGGFSWDLPLGTIYAPNITPDLETGIGRVSDAEIKRLIRTNVRSDGRAAFPMMDFHRMSREDLHDVIAYLRSQPEVENDVPDHSLNFMGKLVMAIGIGPVDRGENAPEKSPDQMISVERGEYLANSVAACMSCHTERNPLDGSYEGIPFAGGLEQASFERDGDLFVTPNLTPDPETGVMTDWDEDTFLMRFYVGGGYPGSPMPWGAYQRMTEEDIRSIYRYLMSLEPVEHYTGEMFRPAE